MPNKCKELNCDWCCSTIEIPAPRDEEYWKIRGIEVINGYAVVRYPCPNLKDGNCMIYDKERPKICKEYKCQKLQGGTSERKTARLSRD